MDIKITIPDEKKNNLILKKMDLLERKFDQQYRLFIKKKTGDNADLQRSFVKKLDALENAIKGISLKKEDTKGKGDLDKSFDRMLSKMEKILKVSRPRMIPSPS